MDGAVVRSPEERQAARLADIRKATIREAVEDLDTKRDELSRALALFEALAWFGDRKASAGAKRAALLEANGACDLYCSAFETLEKLSGEELSGEDDDEPGEGAQK